MKKTAIKMRNYAENVNIVNNNNLSKKLFKMLVCSFGVLAISYVIILGNVVFNIVERQSLGAEAKALSNEVGDLELNYLAISNKIDLAMGHDMGFKETKTQFATRESLSALKFTSNEL